METVGSRLKGLRLAKGWTQQQTAEALGLCTRAALGKFERHECNPSPETLEALANLFEVPVAFLQTGVTEDPIIPEPIDPGKFRINGRPKGRAPVSVYPTTLARVKNLAKANGISVAEALDQIVEFAIKNLAN